MQPAGDQSDEQIDSWTAELMRDVAIRRGVVKVVDDFRRAGGLDERQFERVFAAGGGPPAVDRSRCATDDSWSRPSRCTRSCRVFGRSVRTVVTA